MIHMTITDCHVNKNKNSSREIGMTVPRRIHTRVGMKFIKYKGHPYFLSHPSMTVGKTELPFFKE